MSLEAFIQTVIQGENKAAVVLAEKLITDGTDVYDIVQRGLLPALQALDVKCTSDDFNLLEIMLAGRAMMDVMDNVVAKHLEQEELVTKDVTIILGTIKGDIHELGKHVVRIIMRTAGYRVIDLGKNVEAQSFIEAAIRENAKYIFVSGLISVTTPYVRKIHELNIEKNLGIKIIAGGAALQQFSKEDLQVDYVATDAFDGLHYLQREKENQ